MSHDRTSLARQVAAQVADELGRSANTDGDAPSAMRREDERALARKLIAGALDAEARLRLQQGRPPLDPANEEEVAEEAYARLFGLGRLQRYLDDPRVTGVHVQGHDVVWLKHTDGTRHRGEPVADSDEELVELLRTVAARMGRTERRFDAANPELNLQLPDGSRLFAVMSVSSRPSITIRRHQFDIAFLRDLRDRGTIDAGLESFLGAAVRARKSIVISGDVGCGKTTLMRTLINEIPADERLVTVEDALELGVERFPELHPNVVSLEAREPNIEGEGGVSLDQLVRMGLRMDPDRVFVGEVRGSEVLPMLLAMSQGQDGSMCTIHANSARGVFPRIQMYAVLSPHPVAPENAALLAANAIDLVVHLAQRPDQHSRLQRFVTSVLEVRGAEGADVVTNEVFPPGPDGRATPTGALSDELLDALEGAGFDRRYLLHTLGGARWS